MRDREKVVVVSPSSAGVPPIFGGDGGDIDDKVVQEMREVYREADIPPFLDATAARLLSEGREGYQRFNLDHQGIVESDGVLFLFPWAGTVAASTFMLALKARGLEVSMRGVMLEVHRQGTNVVERIIKDLANDAPPDPVYLARTVGNLIREKYDPFLTHDLLAIGFAADRMRPEVVPWLARRLLGK